jgi:hypothetical protein
MYACERTDLWSFLFAGLVAAYLLVEGFYFFLYNLYLDAVARHVFLDCFQRFLEEGSALL